MEFYLSRYAGTGTWRDPLRPAGSDQPGWSAIDFRPDPTSTAGWAITALPNRDDQADRIYMGNNADGPSAALVTAIQNRFGITLDPTEDRLRRIIPALLLRYARTDGTRWRPLLAAGRQFEVWLGGGLFYSQPVVAGGAGLADDFNRANGAIGGPWTNFATIFNGPGFTIVSNKAQSSGIAGDADGAYATLSTQDHTMTADATMCETLNDINVRYALVATNSDIDRYIGRENVGGGDEMIKVLTGVSTTIGTQVHTITQGSTYTLTMSADGSTIKFITPAGTISVTDTGITGNTSVGITTFTSTGVAGQFDNFTAADLHQREAHGLAMSQAMHRASRW